MRFIIFTFFIVTTVNLSAQEQIKIHWEKIENGYIVYGDNDQNYPMSVKVHFDVENLSIAGQNDAT